MTQLGTMELRKRAWRCVTGRRARSHRCRLLPEAFALVREAGRRTLNMRHFDVQMLGGMAMHHRSIAEMQTGEGKTLTATLPLYLAALIGKGAHAGHGERLSGPPRRRMDAAALSKLLGMTVGVHRIANAAARSGARPMQCDITYGTAKEFGFDFLRDQLLERRIGEGQTDFLGGMLGTSGEAGGDKPVQRPPHFILVDEADSILIDEARTPLIISALPTEAQRIAVESYKWAAGSPQQFVEDEHYDYDHEKRSVELTSEGRRLVRELPKPAAMNSVGMFTIYEYIERAIRVEREFILDRQYVVIDGEIVIVDEFTGRIAEGRKWRDGVHQAVEAKQGVEVTVETGQAARITIQDYFLLYPNLAGMTGTAVEFGRRAAARFTSCGSCRFRPIARPFASGWPIVCSAPATPNGKRSPTKWPSCTAAGGRC